MHKTGNTSIRWALVPVILLAVCSACAADKLQVVTTTTDLAAIARAVGGEHVEVLAIATGAEDPHHLAAKPSYMMAVRRADLWIRTGMELEIGYEPLILEGGRNAAIRVGQPGHLDASAGVIRLEVPTQKVDRSMGDVHPQGNPHYLLDPLNGRIVAKTIAQRLARLVPEHAEYFTERLGAFQRQLDERMFGAELVAKYGGAKMWAVLLKGKLDAALAREGSPPLGGWLGQLKPLAGSKLVTYHRNWTYFAHRFDLEVPLQLESKPGIPPSPGRLTEVIQQIKDEEIKVLMMASYFSKQAPELVSQQTGVKVITCGMYPGAQSEATDYLTTIDNVVNRVSAALSEVPADQ